MLLRQVSSWVYDTFLARPSQRKNIRQAARIRSTLREITGPYACARQLSYLRKVDPFAFEELLLTSFKACGYVIKRGVRYSGDGGVDGIIYNDKGKKILLQAKRYTGLVNPAHVREFVSKVDQCADWGYFIHTGSTGHSVYDILAGRNAQVISGENLLNLIVHSKEPDLKWL